MGVEGGGRCAAVTWPLAAVDWGCSSGLEAQRRGPLPGLPARRTPARRPRLRASPQGERRGAAIAACSWGAAGKGTLLGTDPHRERHLSKRRGRGRQ